MATQERHIELFDKHVLGTINKEEKKELARLIENKPELELEFKTHKLLAEGIKLARKQELKDYLKEHGKVEYFQNIWGKKWRSASAVIVLLFTCSFFLVQYLSKKASKDMAIANKEEIIKPKQSKEDSNSSILNEPITENKDIASIQKKDAETGSPKKSRIEILDESDLTYNDDRSNDTTLFKSLEDVEYEEIKVDAEKKVPQKENKVIDIPIAEERKIHDTTLIAQVYNKDIRLKVTTLSQNEIQNAKVLSKVGKAKSKSNSSRKNEVSLEDAGNNMIKDTLIASDEVDRDKTKYKIAIAVEFWQSPINFKGYQYQTVLKIYGVKKEDVSVIQYNNILYLKVKNKYCRLIKSKEYLPFKYIKDKDLIQKLNGN